MLCNQKTIAGKTRLYIVDSNNDMTTMPTVCVGVLSIWWQRFVILVVYCLDMSHVSFELHRGVVLERKKWVSSLKKACYMLTFCCCPLNPARWNLDRRSSATSCNESRPLSSSEISWPVLIQRALPRIWPARHMTHDNIYHVEHF